MADVETQTRLQVANLAPADSGRGIARLPLGLMKELGLDELPGERGVLALLDEKQPDNPRACRLRGLETATIPAG